MKKGYEKKENKEKECHIDFPYEYIAKEIKDTYSASGQREDNKKSLNNNPQATMSDVAAKKGEENETTQSEDQKHQQTSNTSTSDKSKESLQPSHTFIDYNLNTDAQEQMSIVYTEVTQNGEHLDPKVKWFNTCKDIVTQGKTKNNNIPYLRYKKLITYDRSEIEALRNTYHLFRFYIDNEKIDTPLSICVFGPPGSGKSFAVEQIIESIGKENDKRIFKFNLSQMKEDDLAHVFHQIRDAGLEKKLPIVFFDEFDSTIGDKGTLGWIKHFLAPMQDGKFLDDKGRTHVIGRAIFIFAGGTYHCMNELKTAKAVTKDKTKKIPDFLSRLKGYIDIIGPNPMNNTDDTFGCKLRRATLLRSLLEKKWIYNKKMFE
ncbi:MAG: ATP-binding protein [Nitrososphaerota archaeon]|nr:ATP-binding protein [Nitrososphaerota archaeon]